VLKYNKRKSNVVTTTQLNAECAVEASTIQPKGTVLEKLQTVEFYEFLKQIVIKQSVTYKVYWRHVAWRRYLQATDVKDI
jgi:hypothetical protein